MGDFFHWIPELEPKEFTPYIFLDYFVHFLLFLIIAITMIISSVKARNMDDTKGFEKKWLSQGLALIIIAIIYLINTEILMDYYFKKYFGITGESYWDLYDPGFAIIAPFISGALAIIAVAASKYISKREITPIERKFFPAVEPSISEEPKDIRYCPECGQKIMYKESKFCSSCGFELTD